MNQGLAKSVINLLTADLKLCGTRGDLQWGRRIHAKLLDNRIHLNVYVAASLIKMYSKCSQMISARCVFDSLPNPNVVSWTTLLLGYAENGDGHAALDLFVKMKAQGCLPSSATYIAALKACTSLAVAGDVKCLERGKEIHSEIGSRLDHFVQSTLIVMYTKCGSMVDARRVFDSIHNPDVVCWSALLLGYAVNGEADVALNLFSRMKASGCVPNCVTYVAAVKACASLATASKEHKHCLELGRQIHSEIGCPLDHHLQSSLIEMYAKCGSMVEARVVFHSARKPNVVSWTALLLGYAENGDGQSALDLFFRMKASGCEPDSMAYVAAIKACTSLAVNGHASRKGECLERGREIHSQVGRHLERHVQNTLIDMYAKLGSMEDARRVFDSMVTPDIVSWNALLMGYADNGEGQAVMDLFSKMKAMPNLAFSSITYSAVLKGCSSLETSGKGDSLQRIKEIHSEIGCHMDQYVQSTLIDVYAKCGSMLDARRVFDSIPSPTVVPWTAVILGYAENGAGNTALELFARMKTSGCSPNCVTYVAAVKACTLMALNADGKRKDDCLEWGRAIHLEIGSNMSDYVQNTLMDLYAKCGSMPDAHRVFNSIRCPDVVSWTVLLQGYADNGEGHVALNLFAEMKARGYKPDSVACIAALRACALTGNLALGREFHSDIRDFTPHLVTCLVGFYSKCGSLGEARQVFDIQFRARDVSTWNALLVGYASFGDSGSVLDLFEAMQDGFRPDAITFVSVLMCCSHAGLMKKAREYFEAMPVRYGVTPNAMHYTCMVDALGRANQLNEAVEMIRRMPCTPQAVTWSALLGACCKWKNVEVGRMAFQALVVMDKRYSFSHVLMAQTYGGQMDPECGVV